MYAREGSLWGLADARTKYPEEVYDWIHDYDNNLTVAPATFSFEIPEPVKADSE